MPRTLLITRRDFVAEPGVHFSGGSWLTPMNILSDPRPQTVVQARTPDPADSWFDCDLVIQRTIGMFHFQRLGTTQFGFLRLRHGNDPTFATTSFDTGVISAWPQDKTPGSLDPWGQLTTTGTYISEEYAGMGMPRFLIPPTPSVGRYIRVELQDTTNTQPPHIGVFGACEIWAPLRSPSFGWSIAVVDESGIYTVPYGSRFIVPRGKRRRLSIGFDSTLAKDEVVKIVYGWAQMVGKSQPFAISVFPDDRPNVEKTTIWGTLSQDPEITNPHYATYSLALQLEQLI